MKKKTKKRFKKLLRLPLWVDLLITIIGVVIGLMLTNIYENYHLKKKHQEALSQVWDEIKDNQKVLLEFNNQLSEKFKAYQVFENYWDSDSKVMVPKDSIDSFKLKVASIFKIDSLLPIENNTFRVQGYFEILVGSPLLGGKLRNSVWNSFSKQPDFLSITDFKTISNLEQIHTLQLEVNEQTKEWKKSLYYDLSEGEKERENFELQWILLLLNQKMLIEIYKINLTELKTD